MTRAISPLPGTYPPLPTFFDSEGELDLSATTNHIHLLAKTPITGIVIMGSNGEAVHLSSSERDQLVAACRWAVASSLNPGLQIIAGTGAQSTKETIQNCTQAASGGAQWALVLPPSYYKGSMDKTALIDHFHAVADASPIPIILYNMPAVTGGVDLSEDVILELAKHENIVGLKDSSGNVVKMARVVDQVQNISEKDFIVFAGSASFFLASLAIGAVGTVAALANVLPHSVCRIQTLFEEGKIDEARKLQASLIMPNAMVTTIHSVAGLKTALEITRSYGGAPRAPVRKLKPEDVEKVSNTFAEVWIRENEFYTE